MHSFTMALRAGTTFALCWAGGIQATRYGIPVRTGRPGDFSVLHEGRRNALPFVRRAAVPETAVRALLCTGLHGFGHVGCRSSIGAA